MRCHRKMSMIHCYVKKLQKYVYNIILFFLKSIYMHMCMCRVFFHITRERYERVYIKLFMVTTLSIELEGV